MKQSALVGTPVAQPARIVDSSFPLSPCPHCDSTSFWLDDLQWMCSVCVPSQSADPIRLEVTVTDQQYSERRMKERRVESRSVSRSNSYWRRWWVGASTSY